MRYWCLTGWLLLPLVAAAWHYGPGQDLVAMDEVSNLLGQAQSKAADKEYAAASETYDQALAEPVSHLADARRIRLERAKVQMLAKQLPTAHADLNSLVDELKDDPKADPRLLAEVRESLASAQYYMTWLMRLEGEPREVWEPEIEAARQNYRLLAEETNNSKAADTAKRLKEDLESSVRLAQLDISELQSLPIPCQCQGCKSCNKPGKKPGNKPGKKPDVRGGGNMREEEGGS